MKEQFPILLSAPPYPLQTQVKLLSAACALHNYVRLEEPDDLVFRMFEEDTFMKETEYEEDGRMALEENQGHEHGSFRPQNKCKIV